MSASSAPVSPGAQPHASTTTLRTLLDARRAEGRHFALEEAIATVVPLCLDLKERHARGEKLHVHPSCVAPGADGTAKLAPRQAALPTNARDRACVSPEHQADLAAGDAKSSVFAVGAILYEMLTGALVGPGMPRPREVNPSLTEGLEVLLEKALVADPTHRPDDLGALASALYHVMPTGSVHPPEVDPHALDHTGEFEVDVRMSLLPPEELVVPTKIPKQPGVPGGANFDPFAPVGAAQPPAARPSGPTVNQQLSALKEHLESDPRPRYVVHKDRMDHGPFTAVELLQQIASHTFTANDDLRDELSGQTHAIKDWEAFAPFASHAALHREIVAEKKEVQRLDKAEQKGALAKSTVAIAAVGVLVAIGLVWIMAARGLRKDDVAIQDDPNAFDLDTDGGVRGVKRAGRGGGGGGGGGFPSGMSYEAALATNNQQVTIGGPQGGPDLTDAQLSAPLRSGTFLGACGVPESTHVTVKVAIRMGRAVGVSVYMTPPNAALSSCVDRQVRGLGWPANPKMDSTITSY